MNKVHLKRNGSERDPHNRYPELVTHFQPNLKVWLFLPREERQIDRNTDGLSANQGQAFLRLLNSIRFWHC
jgi:hypothetical protein